MGERIKGRTFEELEPSMIPHGKLERKRTTSTNAEAYGSVGPQPGIKEGEENPNLGGELKWS